MVFTVCCSMHNMLLDVGMDQGFSNVQRVGCACPIGRDALQWMVATRDLLATHLECYKKRNL